jgi:hypothetical protein
VNFLHKAIAQAKAAQDAQTASAAPGTAHTTMIDAMVENLSKPLRARSHKQVHASDVTKEHFCPREIVLRDVLNLPRQDEKVGAALAATFDIGNVTAELVRAKWLGKHALGGWECVKCKEYVPLAPKPATAGASCQHYWKYQEDTGEVRRVRLQRQLRCDRRPCGAQVHPLRNQSPESGRVRRAAGAQG